MLPDQQRLEPGWVRTLHSQPSTMRSGRGEEGGGVGWGRSGDANQEASGSGKGGGARALENSRRVLFSPSSIFIKRRCSSFINLYQQPPPLLHHHHPHIVTVTNVHQYPALQKKNHHPTPPSLSAVSTMCPLLPLPASLLSATNPHPLRPFLLPTHPSIPG